jgi:hypothetical protein
MDESGAFVAAARGRLFPDDVMAIAQFDIRQIASVRL